MHQHARHARPGVGKHVVTAEHAAGPRVEIDARLAAIVHPIADEQRARARTEGEHAGLACAADVVACHNRTGAGRQHDASLGAARDQIGDDGRAGIGGDADGGATLTGEEVAAQNPSRPVVAQRTPRQRGRRALIGFQQRRGAPPRYLQLGAGVGGEPIPPCNATGAPAEEDSWPTAIAQRVVLHQRCRAIAHAHPGASVRGDSVAYQLRPTARLTAQRRIPFPLHRRCGRRRILLPNLPRRPTPQREHVLHPVQKRPRARRRRRRSCRESM
eukprot:scaffold24799_cov79-Isochrysis_galbana.AAC.1